MFLPCLLLFNQIPKHRCIDFADELKNYFASFGVVTECVVKRDPNTGASRGFGFVSFSDPVAVDHVR